MAKRFTPNVNDVFAEAPASLREKILLSDVQTVPLPNIQPNPQNTAYFKQESPEYFDRLREDIKRRGIVVPLIAKQNGMLLTGHNRLKIAQELGLRFVPVQFVREELAPEAEKEFIIKDNLLRRQFSQMEWIDLYKQLFPDFEATFLNEETKVGSGRKKSDMERLTLAQVAAETGQKLNTVKQHIRRAREQKTPQEIASQNTAEKKGYNVTFSEKDDLPPQTKAQYLRQTRAAVQAVMRLLEEAPDDFKNDVRKECRRLKKMLVETA